MELIVAAMNLSLDGYCDHTSMIADDVIHQHYTDLLLNSGAALYGR
jgi:dihydrofolate reductase